MARFYNFDGRLNGIIHITRYLDAVNRIKTNNNRTAYHASQYITKALSIIA